MGWGKSMAVMKARGVVVHGLATRNGHRAQRVAAGVRQWGGKRVKGPADEDYWYHPHAVAADEEALQASVERHAAKRRRG